MADGLSAQNNLRTMETTMENRTVTFNCYKSIADLVLNSEIAFWKKWILRKLMPDILWDLPPQELMKLQKGDVIGSVTVSVTSSNYPDFGIDTEESA